MSQLSAEDQEYLVRSVRDLSDICPCQLARIDAGFKRAAERAEAIRSGDLDPLTA